MDQKERWRLLLIGLATFFLLIGSYFILRYVNTSIEQRRTTELEQTLDQILVGTNEKIISAVDLLYDLRALVSSSKVNADMWENYFLTNQLEQRFPGVFSFAYVERVLKSELVNFENSLEESEGEKYKDYVVFPKSDSAEYFPIKYLHTVDPDISVLLGFDFRYSERTVSAFTEAVLMDKPTISELAHLDLIIPKSKKIGYEIVLPVYSTPDIQKLPLVERRKFLVGFVGAWISPEKLRDERVDLTGLAYTISDNGQKIISVGEVGDPKISITKQVNILNRKFEMTLLSDKLFVLQPFEENLPLISLVGILIIILLWLTVIYSVLSARRQAIELADLATKDLKKFKQAVDGVSDHVIITDPDGVINYANKAATETTGYSLEEMIGKKPSLWGGQMPEEYYKKFWQTIKFDKQPFWGEILNRKKSGELYEAEMRVSPILDKDKNLLFFVGNERDLSRYRAIEKMKTEFISLASHQLRTPLSAVKWFSEMLLGGDAGKLTELQMKYMSKINDSNEREIQLVNALLNVSRIESGKIVVLPKPTNLKELVESIFTETKVDLAGENKMLQYSIDKSIPSVEIDSDLIKHVYTNLLSNAIKYTNPGGKISAKVYVKGKNVISEVTDNGIGIPIEEQKRVFEKFFRASNALKKETEGSGLGLYLTKTIVESSGGKIWYVSNEGKGSSFNFSLPLKIIKKPKDRQLLAG